MTRATPSAGSRAVHPVPQAPATELQPKNILVVDDEESVRRLLAELLGLDGYRVLLAGTAQEALTCLSNHHVALLIIDVQLPDMDGIALLQRMFQMDDGMLGLVVTGHGNVEMAVRAMKAGASDFLAKPFQSELVRHTVTRLMELHRLRHENTVLKQAIIRSGNIRLSRMALTDFGIKEQAHDLNVQAEYQRGLVEGEQRASERLAAVRRQEQELVATAITRLESTWRQLHDTVEQDVASLAFSIAHKVLRAAVEERPDLIVAQVQAALGHVQERGLVRICVHPLDLPPLESARRALAERADGVLTIKLEGDPSIPRGGCLVHTASRLIDATLETQLLRIGEALRERESGETH